MSLNTKTQLMNTTVLTSTTIDVLTTIHQRLIVQLPLIITIFGLIGFLGNLITFLQPNLRTNSFCIYTLFGSFIDIINLFVNLFPNYFTPTEVNPVVLISTNFMCKLKNLLLLFFPQLTMNLLIMSLIDRYACTYALTSRVRYILQLKMVPRLIGITIIITFLMSIYSPILNGIVPNVGCASTHPMTNTVFYILIHGITTPAAMLMLVCMTYRRFKQHRQRVTVVGSRNPNRFRNQFIAMVFTQALVTSFFALQWIIMYWYYLMTQYDIKSPEGWAITFFLFSLTNYLYYLINVRSFYLSTLTSRLYRETLIKALIKLLPRQFYQRWTTRNRQMLTETNVRDVRQDRV